MGCTLTAPTLKTPYRDGIIHVIFEPLNFIARLVTLVRWIAGPKSRRIRWLGYSTG